LGFLLSLSASLFSDFVGFCTVGLGKTVLSREVLFFLIIEIFFLFFWSRGSFGSFLLEIPFSFSEGRVGFLIYLVGMSSRLFLKIGVFVVSLVFLGFFPEIVVEACRRCD
jgi:hypothetical protein